jgi:hypothetical protein
MATTITLELGPDEWDEKVGAWRCATARLPGIVVDAVYAKGETLARSAVDVNTELGLIWWRGPTDKRPPGITIALASQQKFGLSNRAETLRWKRLAIVLPFIVGIVGAILASPALPQVVTAVTGKNDSPSVAAWHGNAGKEALAAYAKGGDAEALTGQWLVKLYDVLDNKQVVPYKIGSDVLPPETAYITGAGSVLTAVTGDTNRKGGIWATGRVSPGNWVTMTVWSDRTDVVSVNLLKVAPDHRSMRGPRIGIDGEGNIRRGEIEYTKLPD